MTTCRKSSQKNQPKSDCSGRERYAQDPEIKDPNPTRSNPKKSQSAPKLVAPEWRLVQNRRNKNKGKFVSINDLPNKDLIASTDPVEKSTTPVLPPEDYPMRTDTCVVINIHSDGTLVHFQNANELAVTPTKIANTTNEESQENEEHEVIHATDDETVEFHTAGDHVPKCDSQKEVELKLIALTKSDRKTINGPHTPLETDSEEVNTATGLALHSSPANLWTHPKRKVSFSEPIKETRASARSCSKEKDPNFVWS